MLGRVAEWLHEQIAISARSEPERAMLRERFIALRRQLPWLYGMFFACLAGIHLTLSESTDVPNAPAAVVLTAIAVRAVHWLRLRSEELPDWKMQRQLLRTILLTAAFCLGCLVWSFALYQRLDEHHRIVIVTFAALIALGCCYGMNSFPAAARIPVLVLALPLAIMLTLSREPAHAGLGISFIVLSIMTLRLLNEQETQFRSLVASRFAIEDERRRAVEAEKVAVAEQIRVGVIADTDPLTGLANRRGFLKTLDRLAASDARALTLILLDLDGFKPVNDTFGHAAGDAMLVEVSRRLQGLDFKTGCIARLGGDEFALICECGDESSATSIAENAVVRLGLPFSIGTGRTVVSCCAGLSIQAPSQLNEAMRRADIALYSAKRQGRGSIAVFSSEMQEEVERRTSIEQALREPGLTNDIELAFQPIFDLETMQLKSFEALARWRHSELGWISPSEFIPITEQLNLVHDISDALLRRALTVAHQWPVPIQLSFNLSAVQLSSSDTAERILRILREQQTDPTRLQVEVTETALLSDFALARSNLSQLRNMGVRIVLDDFGAGYSSISYLREMKFDAVKLDGSLVSAAAKTKSGLPLLRGVLALGREMGQECVAEHIETEHQLQLLRRLGCRYGQGYELSPPVGADEACRMALQLFSKAA